MKKSLVVLLHLGFWSCFLIITLVILGMLYGMSENATNEQVAHTFLAIFSFAWIPSAITFNTFYFYLFPKFVKKQKYGLSIFMSLSISIVAALVGFLNLYNLYGPACIEEAGGETLFWLISAMTCVALISGIIALVIQGFLTWIEEIKLKDQLKEKNQAMEMALVKAQLDPHFLFNTLNNIDVLILKNAKIASDYLNKLSDIMRFMLFETKTPEIPLAKEIEYIEKYIALQKIRTANHHYVNFGVSGVPKSKTIAPMVFIPFIENAFKHTTNKKLKDAIKINIQIEEESVRMDCENKFDESRRLKQNCNGLGNELIQKRLELIYPGQHTLEVVNQEESYAVHLTINNG